MNNNTTIFLNNFRGLRSLFYLVLPSESSFKYEHEVPNYITEAYPFFMLMIIIEFVTTILNPHKYTGHDIADTISSISAGILSQVVLLLGRSIEIVLFFWTHDHFKLIELDATSRWVWLFGMIGVDYAYYWLHRYSHEIALFWSGHQVHHSSQRYNFTTALRQGTIQRFFSALFYIPLAIVMPPSVFIVHLQFNTLYQFWIHTELIGKLGPIIEFIFNTPSHHRVHHGRNKFCVDKNYGGVLIIFDRIFGTFQEEPDRKDASEPRVIAYGNIPPIQTWQPIEVQLCYLKNLMHKVTLTSGVKEKLKTFFYGPGYHKGTSRLGDPNEIPEIERPIKFYHGINQSFWRVFYCSINFIGCSVAYILLANLVEVKIVRGSLEMWGYVLLLIWSLIDIGLLLDGCNITRLFLSNEILRISIFIGSFYYVII